MQRRTFLNSLGWLAAYGAARGTSAGTPADSADKLLMQAFLQKNDARITATMQRQTLAVDSPFRGGIPDRHGIYHIGATARNVCHFVAGWTSPQSVHFRSADVVDRLQQAIEFLRRMQHADGTIDLVSTNFHSPPDTGFAVEPIALAASIADRDADARLASFNNVAAEFLHDAGAALAAGGVHTPNHRWVICRALARINRLYPRDVYVRRIEQWLAEGVDQDADGQYTERSTGVYTPLVNRCFITVARLLDRPALYEPVRKNLKMTQSLVRPNGEMVTEVSRRQDRGELRHAARYYVSYRAMALVDDDPEFSAMASFIAHTATPAGVCDFMLDALEHPRLLDPLPAPSELSTSYERTFVASPLVRIRRGPTDISLIGESPTFLTLHKGAAALGAMRLAAAFFGKGQFQADTLTRQDDGSYLLVQQLRGHYVQPLPDELLSDDGDWLSMPHDERRRTNQQSLEIRITIRETNGALLLHFQSSGTERVPWALECGLRPGGELQGVTPQDGVEQTALAGDQGWGYFVGNDALHFGPGPIEHRWTQLRGALPKLDAQSVYYTGLTPIDFRLSVN